MRRFKLPLFFILLFYISCSPKKLSQDVLFVMLESKPTSLDPRKATDANGMRLVSLIFNGLVKQGEKEVVLPDAALNWSLEDLTYTFYLKKDLYFSNGRAVNKEDILFSFEEFKKKGSPFYSAFKNIKSVQVFSQNPDQKNNHSSSDDMRKKSDQTNFIVKIFLKKFQAPFLYSDLPVIKILPKKELLKSPKVFLKKPLGSGEFEVVENSFRKILLKRRRLVKAPTPNFISFNIIRDSFTRVQKMLSQEVDLAPSLIPLRKISQFKRQKNKFQIFSGAGLSTSYLLINLKNPNLKNKKIREVLSLSINRKEIIKYKLQGYALPARGLINPKSYFFNNEIPIPLSDPEKAKQIIREFHLDGIKLKLSTSNNRDSVKKARVLASQMNQIGLQVSLQSSEWGTFYKDLNQGVYDMALMKWVGVTDPDIYRVAFHSENLSPNGRNRSFYKNEKLDKLLEQGLRIQNKKKRKQIYDQVQLLISKDIAIIPLWHDMEISILKTGLENYKLRRNGDFLSFPMITK